MLLDRCGRIIFNDGHTLQTKELGSVSSNLSPPRSLIYQPDTISSSCFDNTVFQTADSLCRHYVATHKGYFHPLSQAHYPHQIHYVFEQNLSLGK